jgi:hypothetical protein
MNRRTEPTPLEKKIEQVLTECRIVLPGTQALPGFQLSAFLTDAFTMLPRADQLLHLGRVCVHCLERHPAHDPAGLSPPGGEGGDDTALPPIRQQGASLRDVPSRARNLARFLHRACQGDAFASNCRRSRDPCPAHLCRLLVWPALLEWPATTD